MPVETALAAQFGASDEELTCLAGLALVARGVTYLGLAEGLARLVRVKRRWRACRDEQMLLSLIYSFCASGGNLSEVDASRTRSLPRKMTGRLVLKPIVIETSSHRPRRSVETGVNLAGRENRPPPP